MDSNTFLSGLNQIFASGDQEQVSAYLQNSLSRAEAADDKGAVITILNEMIGYYRITSRYSLAISAAERVIALMRELGYDNTVHYGTTLLNAATAYRASGDNVKALDLYNSVLAIYKRHLPEDDQRLAALYNNLSGIHQDAGEYEKSCDYLEKSAKILSKIKGAEIDAATVYTNLALAQFELKREQTAQANLQIALNLFEGTAEDGKVDSRNAPHYAGALAGLAGAYFRMKEFGKAVELFKDALSRIKECYGENRDYAVTCRNCAAAYAALGIHTVAGEYRRKADTILRSLGDGIAGVAESAERSTEYNPTLLTSMDNDSSRPGSPDSASVRGLSVSGGSPGGNSMKGLELARAYYEEYGRAMIRSRFPDFERRIAVGLAGEGSECFGFDDEISRDHDFGPGFCMWLTREDYEKIGGDLQKEYDSLPRVFMGSPARVDSSPEHAGRRVGALRIDNFFSKYIGRGDTDLTMTEWVRVPESSLATAANGEVFYDPLGTFSAIRAGLRWPEDVRLKKISARAALMAQSGQSNYARCLSRGEAVGAFMALGEFVQHASSMIFLINRRFAPFYKWTHRAMRELTLLREAPALLEKLAQGRIDLSNWNFASPGDMVRVINQRDNNVVLIEKLCRMVKEHLQAERLTDSNDDFLIPHAECVRSRIKDKSLRSMHLMEV